MILFLDPSSHPTTASQLLLPTSGHRPLSPRSPCPLQARTSCLRDFSQTLQAPLTSCDIASPFLCHTLTTPHMHLESSPGPFRCHIPSSLALQLPRLLLCSSPSPFHCPNTHTRPLSFPVEVYAKNHPVRHCPLSPSPQCLQPLPCPDPFRVLTATPTHCRSRPSTLTGHRALTLGPAPHLSGPAPTGLCSGPQRLRPSSLRPLHSPLRPQHRPRPLPRRPRPLTRRRPRWWGTGPRRWRG